MRRSLIAGNWKMNLDREQSRNLAQAVSQGIDADAPADVAICPPSVYLDAVAEVLRDGPVGLGAQNMHYEASGAFTGEVSPGMLVDVGCQYVILGHSERRCLFGEQDSLVRNKLSAAFAAGLTPIVCVGETLGQRESGQTNQVIDEQFRGAISDHPAEDVSRLVIAYEPIWAIGTGQVATPDQAEEVHAHLRGLLASEYNAELANGIRIQYGGSVKPDNAAELLGQPNIDGALVGGASLSADSFLAIIASAANSN